MINITGPLVILNNCTSTENISSYFDCHLKSLVPNVLHILEDTRDFLNYIQELSDHPESSILVSCDVVGLYPNIPHGEGMETMPEYLETREDKTV